MFDPETFRPSAFVDRVTVEGDDGEALLAARLVALAVALGSDSDDIRLVLMEEAPEIVEPLLSIPALPPLVVTESWQLIDLIRERLLEPHGEESQILSAGVSGQAAIAELARDPHVVDRGWRDLMDSRDPLVGLAFLALQLWSRSKLLRAVACAALTRLYPGLRFLEASALALLEGEDDLSPLGEVALRNLGVTPDYQSSVPLGNVLAPAAANLRLSILVNGTYTGFPSETDWFWPTGEMASHIRTATPSDLYEDEASFYRWGGAFSSAGRRAAAQQLVLWAQRRGLDGLHMVFAHSHGGNVALDYLQSGGNIDLLVLLHTPVIHRRRSAWDSIADRVGRVLVLSTKLDWVVWLDRGASLPTMRVPYVRALERVLGSKAVSLSPQVNEAWLSHTHYTKPETWRRNNIARVVGYHHSEVHPH